MAKVTPLMILSDSPDVSSGLARITRDLASRIYKSNLPIRLATAGFNGSGCKDFGWTQYQLGPFNTASDILHFAPAWQDFAGSEEGIVLTIYDIPRLEAFRFANNYAPQWSAFLQSVNFRLWGYFPIDGHTPVGGVTAQCREVLRAFDRILAYGPYGQQVLGDALAATPQSKLSLDAVEWLPHGFDSNFWKPGDRQKGRSMLQRVVDSGLRDEAGKPIPRTLSVTDSDKLLGIVATNQQRKDWGAAFEVMALLPADFKFWLHTDKLMNYWSIPDLVDQYGLGERVFVTSNLPDEALIDLYSACDVTLAPGAEGFGLPILESLAVGIPPVVLAFAGGYDLIPGNIADGRSLDTSVAPLTTRVEGPYCIQRPIMNVAETVKRIENSIGLPAAALVDYAKQKYSWQSIWPKWKLWIEGGL